MTTENSAPTELYDADDIEKNKVFGILAYIWILWLVPLLAAKESKFARFHTNEGLVLFLAWLVVWVGLGALSVPLALIPGVNLLLLALWPILGLGFLILAVIGVINAAQGKTNHLPIIGGRFTLIKP